MKIQMSFFGILILCCPLLNLHTVIAQIEDLSSYVNANYGFTMKYPSDWKVNESLINTGRGIFFQSPDGHARVFVSNGTANDITIHSILLHMFNMNWDFPPPGFRLTEFDNVTYSLSGYHAARTVGIESYGGVGEPPTRPGTAPQYKMMIYTMSLLGRVPHTLGDILYHTYIVGYLAPPEYFANYSSTAQRMIDSFQLINVTKPHISL